MATTKAPKLEKKLAKKLAKMSSNKTSSKKIAKGSKVARSDIPRNSPFST